MKPKILSRIEHIIIQIFTYEIIIIDKYKVSIHFSYHIQTIGRNLRKRSFNLFQRRTKFLDRVQRGDSCD